MEGIDVRVKQLKVIEDQYAPSGGRSLDNYVQQLSEWRRREPDSVQVWSTVDATGGWLLLILCKRYGLRPFRRPRQRPTTICIRVPLGFADRVLAPQWKAMVQVFMRVKEQAVDELQPNGSAASWPTRFYLWMRKLD